MSALNSINIMKHLNCFSITCLISISIVFQSHALLSVTIDFQSQLIFSQHSMISISIVFQSTLIFSQHLYCFKITSVSRASCGASGRAFSGASGEVCGGRAARFTMLLHVVLPIRGRAGSPQSPSLRGLPDRATERPTHPHPR